MPRSDKDIILCSILASLWATQAAVVFTEIFGFWHAPLLINGLLLPEAAGRMAPKWDIWIYVVFITVALIAGRTIFRYYHKSIHFWLLVFEIVVTFLMVSALFKILVYYNSPQLAQWSLTALMIISAVTKMFYPELKKLIESIYQRLNMITWAPYSDAWWIAVIVLMIYMPDLQRVGALLFIGESFHHFDSFIMGDAWASLCGQLLSVDVFSEYGNGLPVIFAKLTNALGTFDYVPALKVLMYFVIIYFILTYFLIRFWLKSAWIAGVAFLLVFRLQMFHYGVTPLVWITPSASPLRFGLDIVWMAALLGHMRFGQSRWLILAAIYSGFALYYMTSSGMCVMATFYAYLVALIALPIFRRQWISDRSKQISYGLSWALPVISAFIFLEMTIGTHIFQKEFWNHLLGFMVIFSHSGVAPMFENLKYRHFWFFFMGMVVPFTYLATFLYIGYGLYIEKIKKEWLFTALLCIYGLTNYQYYVVRSLYTCYYVNALPFVMISCFWFMHGLESLPLIWQKRAKATAVALSFYGLLTNQNYLAYPNLINFSRNPMTDNLVIQRFPDRGGYFNCQVKWIKEQDKLPLNDLGTNQEDIRTEDDFRSDAELVAYFHSHFNFQEDASLIKQLTKPRERVVLISSFEIKILIQADRAPFFYYFPLLSARPMTVRTFPEGMSSTPTVLSDTLDELESRRPLYVFMEKVFMQDSLPPSYQEKNADVLAIIAYVRAHYQPFKQGQYLVAMKRKDLFK